MKDLLDIFKNHQKKIICLILTKTNADFLDLPSSDRQKKATRTIVEICLKIFKRLYKDLPAKTDAERDLYANEHQKAFIGPLFDKVHAQGKQSQLTTNVYCTEPQFRKKLRMQLITTKSANIL